MGGGGERRGIRGRCDCGMDKGCDERRMELKNLIGLQISKMVVYNFFGSNSRQRR
jgi:hypothetical protein